MTFSSKHLTTLGGSRFIASQALPALVQHFVPAANPGGTSPQGNDFKFQPPNPVGAGNCIILVFSFSSGQTPSVSDDNGNTWPGSPTVTADSGPGAYMTVIFVLPNANGGVTNFTITRQPRRRPPSRSHQT